MWRRVGLRSQRGGNHRRGRNWQGAHLRAYQAAQQFFEERVNERSAFVGFPAGILIQGGVPILVRGECVGGIGVPGVASRQDEQIAQAGVSVLA